MNQDIHKDQLSRPRLSFKQRVSRRIFNSCFATNRSEQLVFMPYGRDVGSEAYLIEDPKIVPTLESAYTPGLILFKIATNLLLWVCVGLYLLKINWTGGLNEILVLLGLACVSIFTTYIIKKPLEKRLSEHLEGLTETDRIARDLLGDKAPPRVYNVMRYVATIFVGALGVLIIGLAIRLKSLAVALVVICTLGVVAIGFAFYLWETSGRELERLRASSSAAPVLNSTDDSNDADA